jgi:hypothetical protein
VDVRRQNENNISALRRWMRGDRTKIYYFRSVSSHPPSEGRYIIFVLSPHIDLLRADILFSFCLSENNISALRRLM